MVIAPAVLVFAALSAWCAVASEGFLEADGCTHYMYARWAFTYPVYFVDIWGRPFKTALYAPAAATVGLIGVRLTSLAVAIAVAFIAYAIARGQRYRWPALAVVFTFAQPVLFLHSFSELTELPFAMLLGLAFLAYQRQRWGAVVVLAGLLPLSRPEGFGFVLLAAGLLAYHRKWLWLPVLAIPILGWQVAGAMLYREPGDWWRWLPKHWPYAGDSLYPAGPIWHFVALLPAVVGPVVFPLVLIGIGRRAHHEDTKERSESARAGAGSSLRGFVVNHRARCDVLIAVIPLMILVGHSVLYWLGKMASNGEVRYLLIVAPFWALLACRGWGWAWERAFGRGAARAADLGDLTFASVAPSGLARDAAGPPGADAPGYALPPLRGSSISSAAATVPASSGGPSLPRFRGWRSPYRYAAVAALLPVMANWGYQVLPLVQTEDWQTAARIAEWYQTSGVQGSYPRLLVAHPGVIYALDRATLDPSIVEWSAENLAACGPGSLVIADDMYSRFNADRRKQAIVTNESPWLWLGSTKWATGGPNWSVWVSPVKDDGSPTPTAGPGGGFWKTVAVPEYGLPHGIQRGGNMAPHPFGNR